MSRRQKEPLRAMTEEEEAWVKRIARAMHEPATHVVRAKQLLAVAAGQSYSQAARLTGRRSGDAVATLVSRFNREGVHALERRAGGGRKPTYGMNERGQIITEARRCPQPAQDGTATWSLQLLQRALRKQDPQRWGQLSTFTIWAVLHEAGLQWGRTRSWCETGQARRKRKSGVVTVIDPDTEAKKT
jgi:transposase